MKNPREINDHRRRVFGARDASRVIAFVCECGEPDCGRSVLLTAAEYGARVDGVILHADHAPDPLVDYPRSSE